MGIHPSTFYPWRKLVRRGGLEMLRPRERRIPQMPNHTPVFVEQKVVAYALGNAGEGPKRIPQSSPGRSGVESRSAPTASIGCSSATGSRLPLSASP